MSLPLNASSSDLERARALAHRLRPDALRSATAPRGAAARGPAAPVAAPVAAPAAPPVAAPVGGSAWQARLEACRAAVSALGLLLMDASGLAVGAAGEWTAWPPAELEGLGARVMVALEQAERLEGPWERSRSVAFLIGGRALAGLRLGSGDDRLTLALYSEKPLSAEALSLAAGSVDGAFSQR